MPGLRYVRRQMDMVRDHYDLIMSLHPDGMPSRGKIAAFDRLVSPGGRITRPTEETALKAAELPEFQARMMAWYACVHNVFCDLVMWVGSPGLKRHKKRVADVLMRYVFAGESHFAIAETLLPKPVARQYVDRLYDEAVYLVSGEARKNGLL